jgi:hypothetical protein
MKVTSLTAGGLTGGWKQSKKFVVTTNCEKSAEAIVPDCHDRKGKGRTKGDEGQ